MKNISVYCLWLKDRPSFQENSAFVMGWFLVKIYKALKLSCQEFVKNVAC